MLQSIFLLANESKNLFWCHSRSVFFFSPWNEIAEIAIIIIDCDGIVPNESYFSKWMCTNVRWGTCQSVHWQSSLNCSLHAEIDCILSGEKKIYNKIKTIHTQTNKQTSEFNRFDYFVTIVSELPNINTGHIFPVFQSSCVDVHSSKKQNLSNFLRVFPFLPILCVLICPRTEIAKV